MHGKGGMHQDLAAEGQRDTGWRELGGHEAKTGRKKVIGVCTEMDL